MFVKKRNKELNSENFCSPALLCQRRAQVTIFIIVAVVLVGILVIFLFFRGSIFGVQIPATLEPVYTTFLSCLEEDAKIGGDVLESRGGYIEPPNFEPGSTYMPFSNQLNFLGNPVPYWYYVSGNNIQKEQVPSKGEMEKQLAGFIEEKISRCLFEKYYAEGFEIISGTPKASVGIGSGEISVSLGMDLSISKGEESVSVSQHEITVKSDLGKLYDSAREIYDYEQSNLFLENYAVDNLRLYAPVDGVELSCSPLTWNAETVFEDLGNAIEANTMALKLKEGDYSLAKEENKYFITDLSVEGDVRFLNSKQWPHVFEVEPSDGVVMIANPVGNSPGMGILGFCYVPYHFVYSVGYPVLVQISSGEEIFQFPMAVVLKGNSPRESLDASAVDLEIPGFCNYKNTLISVNVYNTKLNPVDADIAYKCSGTQCEIGKTSSGFLKKEFPQCVNGFVLAKAKGYQDAQVLYSTDKEGSVEIIMDKLYDKSINLKLDGKDYGGSAIISFISEGASSTVVYPEQRNVELSEGQYEISVQIFRNSSLRLDSVTKESCVDVPQSGLGGLFGLTKEKCFDFELPAQIVSNALAGGGTEDYYILESELSKGSSVEINAESLPTPKTIEELQNNYLLFEDKGLNIYFP